MRLLTKFNLVFLCVFGTAIAAAAWLSYRFLEDGARNEVIRQAQLMMQAMHSARDYTSHQIEPLLVHQQIHQRSFLPQTVPAYAATESFNYLRKAYPEYEYKEAALNPTNLRDRAVDWEADIINSFRNHPDRRELIGERDTPTGRALFLARPITTDTACLECHSRAETAPTALIRHYGRDNGFGWGSGEVIGAQIVSVPMAVPLRLADSAFRTLLIYLFAVFAVCMLLMDLLLLFAIVRPAARLSALADQISTGNLDVPELPVKGRDEISKLAESFNRMRTSLEKALKLLNE